MNENNPAIEYGFYVGQKVLILDGNRKGKQGYVVLIDDDGLPKVFIRDTKEIATFEPPLLAQYDCPEDHVPKFCGMLVCPSCCKCLKAISEVRQNDGLIVWNGNGYQQLYGPSETNYLCGECSESVYHRDLVELTRRDEVL